MKELGHYLFRLKEEKRPFRFLMSRLLWKTRACMLFRIKLTNHYFLRFFPTAFSAQLWVGANNIREDDKFFQAYLRKNDCVVDIGANIGYLTLVAASIVGPAGKVYSVEAHPNIHNYLKKNIGLNHCLNIETYNLAVGDKNINVKFSDNYLDDTNKVNFNGKGITIEQKRLDDLQIMCEKIHLLKIDVEGYEKFVIDGAPNSLRKTACVYFESWQHHFDQFEYSCANLMRSLKDQGFEIYKIDSENKLLSVDDNYVSEICENMVAISDINEFLKRMDKKYEII